jgi:hypothetical protein
MLQVGSRPGRNAMDLNALTQNAVTTLVAVAWKVAGALAL